MKKRTLLLPLVIMLTGCSGDKFNIPEMRAIMINGNHLCFSVDKKIY